MPFYKWMIQNHIDDNTTIGSIARLMEANKHRFRRARGYTKARGYLETLTTRQDYLDAFDRAWGEYRRSQLQEPDA